MLPPIPVNSKIYVLYLVECLAQSKDSLKVGDSILFLDQSIGYIDVFNLL